MNTVQPFATATWSLVPRRTAVVVIDMQNDFLHSEGWYAQSSLDITHMQAAIGPTRTLVAEARARGVPIIWTWAWFPRRAGRRSIIAAAIFGHRRSEEGDVGV